MEEIEIINKDYKYYKKKEKTKGGKYGKKSPIGQEQGWKEKLKTGRCIPYYNWYRVKKLAAEGKWSKKKNSKTTLAKNTYCKRY